MGSVTSAQVTGAFLVERGLLTAAQLAEALEHQRVHGGELDQIVVEHFGVPAEQVRSPSAGAGRDIGEILLARGTVALSQLEEARSRSRATGQPVGPILVDLGAITRMELASALTEQWSDRPAESLPSPGARDRTVPAVPAGSQGVEDLRFAMRALEASVRAAKGRSGEGEAALDELKEREHELAERVEALEQRHAVGRAEIVADVTHVVETARTETTELRAALAELESRLSDDGMPARLDGLAARIEELASVYDPALEAVAERLGTIESGAASSERLKELESRVLELLDVLHARVEETVMAEDARMNALDGELTRVAEGWAAERSSFRERIAGIELEGTSGAGSGTSDGPGLAAMSKEIEQLRNRLAEHEHALVEHFSRREQALAERVGLWDDADSRIEELSRLLEEQRVRIERLAPGGGGGGVGGEELKTLKDSLSDRIERLAASIDWRVKRVEETPSVAGSDALEQRLSELREQVEALVARPTTYLDMPAVSHEGPTYLALVPVVGGHQLVEIPGPSPTAGDAITSPLGSEELVVVGIGTSPLPGDARACVFVEPAAVQAASD